MSVVQRCPSCGTTQATAGECEACHESSVRFYCTNHEPGRWLDGRTCPACDARRAGATDLPPAHRAPPRARHVAAPAPARSPTPAPRRARPAPTADAPPVWREPEARRPGDKLDGDDLARPAEVAPVPGPSREPGWMSVLRGVSLARSTSPGVPATTVLRLIGTLVKRVLLIGVVLVVAAAVALYLIVRDLL